MPTMRKPALRLPIIRTSHVYPPIPTRNTDWCAYFDGHEEAGPYGWGPTEAAAIADLQYHYDADYET